MNGQMVVIGDGTWTWSRDGIRVEARDPRHEKGAVRAVLTVFTQGELAHRDRVLLTSARERQKYLDRAAEAGVDVDPPALLAIEDAIRQARGTPAPEVEAGGEVPEERREEAEALLADPDLLERAIETIADRGLVEEKTNARVVLLSGIGGLVEAPIHLVVHGDSSAGKNHLVRRGLELLPPSKVLAVSGLSEHALEYRGGRIEGALVVDEAEGQGHAEYGLRVAMSEGRITRLTVNKGDDGGNEAQELEVEVDASVITTTTAPALHAENQTRVFDLFVDESKELTKKVLRRRAREAAGKVDIPDEEVLKLWRTALGMLEPAPVEIPWSEAILDGFPMTPVRARRDFPRVLALVEACALFHQKQRPRNDQEQVIATREDWAIVRPLVQKIVGPSMTGLNEKAIALAELHDELVEGQPGPWLRRVDLENEAAARGIASANTVHKYAKRLAELGVWEGRKNKGAWEHRRLRDAVREPIPLPTAEELPATAESTDTSQTPIGRRLSHNHGDSEQPPNPPKTGVGRCSSYSEQGSDGSPNETPRRARHTSPSEASPDWEAAEAPRDASENASHPGAGEDDGCPRCDGYLRHDAKVGDVCHLCERELEAEAADLVADLEEPWTT